MQMSNTHSKGGCIVKRSENHKLLNDIARSTSFSSIKGSNMKLQVHASVPYSYTPNNANPNFNYTFLKSVFGTSSFNSCSSTYYFIYQVLESPFPAPEHTIALFSSKCVYFVSPGYMFMWFHPEFSICSSSVHKQSLVWCAGVPPLLTEHLAAT